MSFFIETDVFNKGEILLHRIYLKSINQDSNPLSLILVKCLSEYRSGLAGSLIQISLRVHTCM